MRICIDLRKDANANVILNQLYKHTQLQDSFGVIMLALVNIVRFLIQGMGFSGFAVFAGVFEMVARALVGLVFVPIFGFIAACFASPLAWIFADCFLIPAFFHCRKKLQSAMTR